MKRVTSLLVAVALSACGGPASQNSNTPDDMSDSSVPASDSSVPSSGSSTPAADSSVPASGSSGSVVESAGLTTQNCSQLTVSTVTANGDDGDVPANVVDNNLDTRWSQFGKGSWLNLDLGSVRSVSGAAIAWHLGDQRANAFTLSTSTDGVNFTQAYSGQSGSTLAAQTVSFSARDARYLRITVNGNTLNDWASIAEARVCGSGSGGGGGGTGASVVWRGDFETGSRSQWSGTEMVSADRLQVVSSPTRQGGYALKATVKQGDDPINGSGNRNELLRMTHEPEGSEYYYKWSTMFATDFPSVDTWQLFTQWHHEGLDGSPPVEFYVRGERIFLRLQGRDDMVVWNTPLVRGQWLDFVFHVKWSSKANVGFVELYYNGKLVLPKKSVATMYAGDLNYLKIGLYRDAAVKPVGVVYHDGWIMARDAADVLP